LLFQREFSFHFLASLLFAQKLSLIINLVSHNMCGTCNDFTYLFKPHLLFSNVCSMLLLCIWKFGKSQKRSSYYWKKHHHTTITLLIQKNSKSNPLNNDYYNYLWEEDHLLYRDTTSCESEFCCQNCDSHIHAKIGFINLLPVWLNLEQNTLNRSLP
jgi:hypothetical protein